MNEFSWDNKFAGAQALLASVSTHIYIYQVRYNSTTRKFSLNLISTSPLLILFKEFYNGKNELGKFKNDVESFVCALMPGSSSQQIKPTPGNFHWLSR